MESEKPLFRELRVLDLPEETHLKIERFIAIEHGRTSKKLNKSKAAVLLLEKATKSIKLIEQ